MESFKVLNKNYSGNFLGFLVFSCVYLFILSPLDVLANEAALKYKGFLSLGSQGVSNVACEFYVSKSDEDSYELIFTTLIHGEPLAPDEANFLYFNSSASNGSKFSPVNEPQGHGVLALSSLSLKPEAIAKGSVADINALSTLISQRDLESSMILTFKPGVSFEGYSDALDESLEHGATASQDFDLLNTVDRMNLVFWHAGHYDTPKCEAVVLEGVVSLKHSENHSLEDHDDHADHDNHEDDHSVHDHEH